jgi:tetratricopeptide (TPR) repeat protein
MQKCAWKHPAILAMAILSMTFGGHGISSAALQGEIKPHEVGVLPEYCRHTITFSPTFGSKEGTRFWLQELGEPFKAMHHYCWALIALNRANRFSATPQEKRHNYSSAASDIEFVLRYANDEFVLMPEILTRRAEALIKLEEFRGAERDLGRAIQIKADYWPAYAALAQSFQAQGNVARAIRVLEEGIGKVKDPRMLQRLLNQYQGKAK